MSRQRLTWSQVPSDFAAAVETALGAEIVAVENIPLGFSPGPAGPCQLGDGRRVFLKAAGISLNPDTPEMLRSEAQILLRIGPFLPCPALIAVVDDGEWVAVVTELLDGKSPTAPLSQDDIGAILNLAEHLADPSLQSEVQKSEILPLGASGDRFDRLHWIETATMADRLPQWARDHLGALCTREQDWASASAGDHLLHGDLRADNIVIGQEAAWAVDWPAARLGARWVDFVALLPSLHLDGAGTPHTIFEDHPIGRSASPVDVTTFLVHLAGYFVHNSLLPEPPGLTGLRAFQAAQGRVALDWLMHRWPK
jgi:hypothetical protein